jgi:hypothetical protein
MKGIFLAVVVICALAIAGIGGVFADYQDIETSHNNTFETGSLDLLVSYRDGLYEDPNVPQLINTLDFMPECIDKSFHFDLHNAGVYTQGNGDGWVYLHIKNAVFTDSGRTEPEDAVECNNDLGHGANAIGELCDGTYIYSPGWGASLNELGNWMEIGIYVKDGANWYPVDLSAYDTNDDDMVSFNEAVCNTILISRLGSEETIDVKIDLWFNDIPEEAIGYDLFPGTSSVFNDWPTNALQDDQVTFDISFELLQFAIPVANNDVS